MLLKRTVFRKCTEVWLSLVERCVRDAEAAGSSPVTSTTKSTLIGCKPKGLQPIWHTHTKYPKVSFDCRLFAICRGIFFPRLLFLCGRLA